MIKSKGILILLLFFLVISFSANVYSFKNMNSNTDTDTKETEKLKEEIKTKEKEINILTENKKSDDNESSNTEDDSNKENESNENEEKNIDKEIENSVKKFIEYAFSNNEEDYATRKKLAENYMTDDLIETLFSADGINEDTLEIIMEVEDVEVFPSYEDNQKIIVRYIVNESKAEGEYNESLEKYSEIKIDEIDNSFKVTGIKPLSTDDWGI